MKNINLICIVLNIGIAMLFSNCKKSTNNSSSNSSPTKVDSIVGYVQKGPFVNGSSVTIFDLNSDLSQTGKSFNTQIEDDKGSFSISNITLSSKYALLKGDGYYFDELHGVTDGPLTLYGLADVSDESSINLNLITHLEKDRVENLMQSGKSFTESKQQAEKEILALFGIVKNDMQSSEKLNISEAGEDNAILLAISLIIQCVGVQNGGSVTELLANISNDIKNDGVINNNAIDSNLFVNALWIDTSYVKDNLQKKYADLGITLNISDFGKYIANFITTNSVKFTGSDIYYPDHISSPNLLKLNDTVYNIQGDGYCDLAAYTPGGKNLSIKIYQLDEDTITHSSYFLLSPPNQSGIAPALDSAGLYAATIMLPPTEKGWGNYHYSQFLFLGPPPTRTGHFLIEYFVNGNLIGSKTVKINVTP